MVEKGVPSYLTHIISSTLSWLKEGEREAILHLASARLTERSGRSALPSITRTFRIPVADGESEVKIHEPALTEDRLGHKTWGSANILAKLLWRLKKEYVLREDLNDGERLRILELGAGTGLAGIAASKLWPKATVHLTDLFEIVPNLEANIHANSSTNRRTIVTAGVLDWSACPSSGAKNRYDLILAADSLYDDSHAPMLVNVVDTQLKRSEAANVLTVLPYRDMRKGFHDQLQREMEDKEFQDVEQGDESGGEDWNGGAQVEFWWCLWARKE